MEQILGFLKPMIEMYSNTFPSWAITVFTIVGSIRVFMKPIMGLLDAYVTFTPSKTDDAMPDKVKANPIYKGIVYVIDWFGSVKLKK